MTEKNSKETLLQVPSVLKERYQIVKKLGGGGFGEIYDGRILETGQSCAVKVESNVTAKQVLKMEAAVLRKLQHIECKYACQFLGAGKTDKVNYVVMTLLGSNLSELRKKQPEGRFTWSTTFRLSVQLLRGIQAVHDCGFLHRDIKPSNFAMGSQSATRNICYILDFGLARQYITATGEIRDPRPIAGFRGTVRYASINAHRSVEMGRHDDLWSLFYMLMEFLHGQLPWRRLKEKEDVAKEKDAFDHREFLVGLPEEFEEILDHLESLDYYASPDYAMMEQTFAALIAKYGFSESDPLDWETDLTGSVPSTSGVSHQAVRGGGPSLLERIAEARSREGEGDRSGGGGGGRPLLCGAVLQEQGTKTHCSAPENFSGGDEGPGRRDCAPEFVPVCEEKEKEVVGKCAPEGRQPGVVLDRGNSGVTVAPERLRGGGGVQLDGIGQCRACVGVPPSEAERVDPCKDGRRGGQPSPCGIDGHVGRYPDQVVGSSDHRDHSVPSRRGGEEDRVLCPGEKVIGDYEALGNGADRDADIDEEEEEVHVGGDGVHDDILAQVNQVFDESGVSLSSRSSRNPAWQQQQWIAGEQGQPVVDAGCEVGRDSDGGGGPERTTSHSRGVPGDPLREQNLFGPVLIDDTGGTVAFVSAGVGLSSGVLKGRDAVQSGELWLDGTGFPTVRSSRTAAASVVVEAFDKPQPTLRPTVCLHHQGSNDGDDDDSGGDDLKRIAASDELPPLPGVAGEKCDPVDRASTGPPPLLPPPAEAEWLPGNRGEGCAVVGDLTPHPKPNSNAFGSSALADDVRDAGGKGEETEPKKKRPSPPLLSGSSSSSLPSFSKPPASSEAGQSPFQARRDSDDLGEKLHFLLPDNNNNKNNNNDDDDVGPAQVPSLPAALSPPPHHLAHSTRPSELRSSPTPHHSLAALEIQGTLGNFRESRLFFGPGSQSEVRGGVADDGVDPPPFGQGERGSEEEEEEERELVVSIEAPSSQRLPSDQDELYHQNHHLGDQNHHFSHRPHHHHQLNLSPPDRYQDRHFDDFITRVDSSRVHHCAENHHPSRVACYDHEVDHQKNHHHFSPGSSHLLLNNPQVMPPGQPQVPIPKSLKSESDRSGGGTGVGSCTEDVTVTSSGPSSPASRGDLVLLQAIKSGGGGQVSTYSDSFEEDHGREVDRDDDDDGVEDEEKLLFGGDDPVCRVRSPSSVVDSAPRADVPLTQSPPERTTSPRLLPRLLLPLTVIEEEAPVITPGAPKGADSLLSSYDSNSRQLSPIKEEEVPVTLHPIAEAGPDFSHPHHRSVDYGRPHLQEDEALCREKRSASNKPEVVVTGVQSPNVESPPPLGSPRGLTTAVLWELLGIEECDPGKPLPLPRPPSGQGSSLPVRANPRRRRFKQIVVKPTTTTTTA